MFSKHKFKLENPRIKAEKTGSSHNEKFFCNWYSREIGSTSRSNI